jgi:cytochrome b561
MSPPVLVYDRRTIWLHWASAALIALIWGSAQVIDLFPPDGGRVAMRSLHIVMGVCFGVVLLARIAWRVTGGRRLPAADSGLLHLAGEAAHYALYALMLAEVVLGLANLWVRGDSIFGLYTVPAYDPGNRDLRRTVGGLHGLAANAILIVVGLHAAAALFHHYIWRDGVLRRMLPGI